METATTTIMVPGPDGRELCVESAATPTAGRCSSTDGHTELRHLYPPLLADAERRGIRLLSYDRPGYGRSTASPGGAWRTARTTCAPSPRRSGSTGWASGASRVAAPTRWPVLRCCPTSSARWLAGVDRPYGSRASTSSAAWARTNLDDITLFLSDPVAARRSPGRTETSSWRSRRTAGASWATLLSGADLAALNDDLAEYMVSSMKDGLEPGDQGWWDDACAHMADWGFGFATSRFRLQLWHGEQDRFVRSSTASGWLPDPRRRGPPDAG